jgi:GH25 family lysozyme M1 (1,4-beta-N-acetylmuramidase)
VTIFGPDISNNNGVVNIDAVADEGYAFVFAKVTEGAGFKDKYWARTRDWCAQRGLICVGYHYVKTDDPNAQARNFRDNGGGPRVMFDFEANSGNINNFWACVNAFNALGIAVVLSYIPKWYWSQIGSPDISNIPGLLISSNYRAYTDQVASNNGWAQYGGRNPDIWQYTDAQAIAGLRLDCNAFRGSKEQLAELLGLAPARELLIPGIEDLYV